MCIVHIVFIRVKKKTTTLKQQTNVYTNTLVTVFFMGQIAVDIIDDDDDDMALTIECDAQRKTNAKLKM